MAKTFTLPSGKTAVIRDGKGKDLFKAQKMANAPDEIMYALIARLTEIDGKPVRFEDLGEMDLQDLLVLITQSGISDFLSLQPATLSTSAKTPDGDTGKSAK